MGNFTPVNPARVIAYIQKSRSAARHALQSVGKKNPSAVEISNIARTLLKRLRGSSSHKFDYDYDLAAAEHYMFIRFLAGEYGDPTCYVATQGYSVLKVVKQAFGDLQSEQAQSDHPVLPANPFVYAWGQMGVVDGLEDYKQVTGGADYRLGAAHKTYEEFLAGKHAEIQNKELNIQINSEVRKLAQ